MFDAAVDGNETGFVGPLDFPGSLERQPVVRLFLLVTVVDFLAEQAVLVVDAVPAHGHVERGQRVQKAGRQPSQAAVAERGISLRLLGRLQRDTHLTKRVSAQIVDTQINQVVGEQSPQQIFD